MTRGGDSRSNDGGASPSLFVTARDNRSAFAEVYAEYHPLVLRYFARRTFDPDIAFDLMAETFAELFADISNFRGATEKEGLGWMWVVARHKLWDWIEQGRVEQRYRERVGRDRAILEIEDYERIEELVDFEGAAKLVRTALASLSEDERRVLMLRVVDELPFEQIAKALGARSSGAARQREAKARRKLAETMDTLDSDPLGTGTLRSGLT